MTAGNEIVIEELGGSNPSRIILRNRAMPYRAVAFPRSNRVKTIWYQGNPRATQQVLGPEYGPTEFHGTWKAKFLVVSLDVDDADADVVVSGPIYSDAAVIGQTAAQVVTIFETLHKRAQEVRVTWGAESRRGILKDFEPTYDRVEDVPWRLLFEWNGLDETVGQIGMNRGGDVILGGQNVQQNMVNADDSLTLLPARDIDPRVAEDLFTRADVVRGDSLSVIAHSRSAANMVTVTIAKAQAIASAAENVAQNGFSLSQICQAQQYLAFSDSDGVVSVLRVETFRRTVGRNYDGLVLASYQERDAALSFADGLKDTFSVRAGTKTTLRDLAKRYLGAADAWPDIARVNRMSGSAVDAGTIVFIPRKRMTASGAGAFQ